MKEAKVFLLFCLFLLVPILAYAQNLSHVLISEVYYNPDESHKIPNKEGWFEWIEIVNIDDTPIDLKNWKICDSKSCDLLIKSQFLVQPYEKVLILPTSTVLNFWPNIPSSTKIIILKSLIGDRGLNNNGERIALLNQNKETIDEVCYGEIRECMNYCPAIPEGYSLERNFLVNELGCQFFIQPNPNPGIYTFEKYWHKFIFDPLEEVPLDIISGFLIYGEEEEILSYLPSPGHFLLLGCNVLLGRISLKNFDFQNLQPYFGVGIKLENLKTKEIYLFTYEFSSFSPYLLYSSDGGKSWELRNDIPFFIYFIGSLENLYFNIKLDEIKNVPLQWKISFISGKVNPETFEYQIFDQTKEVILSSNQPPIPIINFFPKNPVKGIKVKLDASSSIDPDGEIKEFFWEIKRGEKILATSAATTTTFSFPENGEYQITLTVTDEDGATSSTSTTIKVEPFSFAIITDLHIGRGYPDYDGEGFDDDGYNGEEYYLTQRLRNVVKWINENKDNIDCGGTKCSIKFVAVLGDIADSAEKSEFCKAKEILDELEIPYIPIFGNHDVWPYTEKESAPSPLGEDFFERIFWSTPSIPCENASSTRNFETLLKEFNFERDTQNPKFKNFIFNYGGINFIGLDFNSREKACEKECGVKGKGATHPETINWLKNRLANFSKDTPIILFSHHPITKSGWEIRQGRLIYVSAFSPEELEELKNLLQNYNIQFVLSGHVHGFEKFGKEAVKFSPLDIFFTANWLYSSFPNIPVLTTEALMVGSNENDEVLEKSEFDKGIVRVVKIFDSNNLNFEETAAKYSPRSGEGKEFVALNPYISWAYKFLENSSNPCIFLKSHPFTNRDISSFEWDLGNGEKRYGKVIPLYCYSATGTYTITSTVTDAKTGWKEWITRKIEIKEGLFSKIIKIKDEIKEKTEIISQKIGENLLEFGNYLIKGKDRILLKIKHSPSIPLADLIIDFDEATGDIDLSQMIFDSNLKEKKSILYMPTWPKVVKEKILLLPK